MPTGAAPLPFGGVTLPDPPLDGVNDTPPGPPAGAWLPLEPGSSGRGFRSHADRASAVTERATRLATRARILGSRVHGTVTTRIGSHPRVAGRRRSRRRTRRTATWSDRHSTRTRRCAAAARRSTARGRRAADGRRAAAAHRYQAARAGGRETACAGRVAGARPRRASARHRRPGARSAARPWHKDRASKPIAAVVLAARRVDVRVQVARDRQPECRAEHAEHPQGLSPAGHCPSS